MNDNPPLLKGYLTHLSILVVALAQIIRLAGYQHQADDLNAILGFLQAHGADVVTFIGLSSAAWGRFRAEVWHQDEFNKLFTRLVDQSQTSKGGQYSPSSLKPGSGSLPSGLMPGLLLACVCLSSCTIHPVITKTASGNDVAWLGGSLMTRSSSEDASITTRDGALLTYHRSDGDETVVPSNYLRTKVLTRAIDASRSVLNTATKASAGATTTAGQAMPAVAGAAVGAGITAMSSTSPNAKPKTAPAAPASTGN